MYLESISVVDVLTQSCCNNALSMSAKEFASVFRNRCCSRPTYYTQLLLKYLLFYYTNNNTYYFVLRTLFDEKSERDRISTLEADHCQIFTDAIDFDQAFPVGVRDGYQLVCHSLDLSFIEFGKIQGASSRCGGGRISWRVIGSTTKNVDWFVVVQIDLELLGEF